MKKLAVVTIVALAVVALLVAGCGGGSKSSTPSAVSNAQAVLKNNQAKMQGTKSFKVKGSYTVNTPQAEVKTETQNFSGDIQVISGNSVSAHLTSTPSGGGAASEVYVVDGIEYTYTPNKGWEQRPLSSAGGLSSGVITPNTISDLSKYAQKMKMTTDKSGAYVITFDIGSQFIDQLLKQSAAAQGTQSSGPEGTAAQQLQQTMKELLSGLTMTMTYKVDKNTLLADSAVMKVSLKGSGLGDISADINMAFAEYDVPVTITLPPEAKAAPQAPETSFPNIPGLGL